MRIDYQQNLHAAHPTLPSQLAAGLLLHLLVTMWIASDSAVTPTSSANGQLLA